MLSAFRPQAFLKRSVLSSSRRQAVGLSLVSSSSRYVTPNSSVRIRTFSQGSKSVGAGESTTTNKATFLERFLGPKPMPPRHTFAWYREMILICTVFAITGTSTMMLVRPAVKNVLGLQGSFKDGPWAYRISTIVIMSPLYSILLVVVGTVFGRHAYFRFFSVRMLSRFGIPPELLDKNFEATKKTFKKW